MTGLRALLKKELKEQLKTYKLPIVAGVSIVLFGVGLPLMIRYFNLVVVVGDRDLEIPVIMTGAEVLGAYAGHLELWGVLAVVLIGMGAIARERKSGTAAMTLCKPVGRGAFVMAKLVGLCVTFFLSLGLAGLVCYDFTDILFEELNGLPSFLYLNFLLGLFFLTCLSMVLLYSSLFKSQLAAGGVGISFHNGAGDGVLDTWNWGLHPHQISKLG
jgi:ABC-2 type transport system permease protein